MRTRFACSLHSHFDEYGNAAAHCDLAGLEALLPSIPDYVRDVLQKTQAFVRNGKPEAYFSLRDCYQRSEVMRKTSSRARLANTIRSAQRRAEWDRKLNTDPLHYRWYIVRDDAERPEWPLMSNDELAEILFYGNLEAARRMAHGSCHSEHIFRRSRRDRNVAAGSGGYDLDGDRPGSRVELVRAIEGLRGRVRILAQEGRVPIPSKQLPILKLLDKFLLTIVTDETETLFPCESSAVAFS